MSFKELDQSTDISTQLSAINEIVPLTGTFFESEFYTKTYVNITSGSALSGGFWQTTYDGAPTATSASALMDFTYGISSASFVYSRSETFLKTEKNRIYRQMAKRLLGDEDSLFSFNSVNAHDVVFMIPKRRIFKDEIKKSTVSIVLQITGSNVLTLTDTGAASSFTVGTAGDEASLYSGSTEVGKVYYNAGVVVFNTGAFIPAGASAYTQWSASFRGDETAVTGNIDNFVTGLREHIESIQFHNQTNLHSTLYFCRALNSEFNYSTNDTFLDGDNRIIVTSGTDNQTRTYVTTIGLYDINDRLLAVAKTSEPVKKSPDSELVFRVRLSY